MNVEVNVEVNRTGVPRSRTVLPRVIVDVVAALRTWTPRSRTVGPRVIVDVVAALRTWGPCSRTVGPRVIVDVVAALRTWGPCSRTLGPRVIVDVVAPLCRTVWPRPAPSCLPSSGQGDGLLAGFLADGGQERERGWGGLSGSVEARWPGVWVGGSPGPSVFLGSFAPGRRVPALK